MPLKPLTLIPSQKIKKLKQVKRGNDLPFFQFFLPVYSYTKKIKSMQSPNAMKQKKRNDIRHKGTKSQRHEDRQERMN